MERQLLKIILYKGDSLMTEFPIIHTNIWDALGNPSNYHIGNRTQGVVAYFF